MDIWEIACDVVDWINLSQNEAQWRTWKLTSGSIKGRATISFSRRTLLRELVSLKAELPEHI
jgi:hypothetical protein